MFGNITNLKESIFIGFIFSEVGVFHTSEKLDSIGCVLKVRMVCYTAKKYMLLFLYSLLHAKTKVSFITINALFEYLLNFVVNGSETLIRVEVIWLFILNMIL